MQRTINVGVFKFVSQQAGDSCSVFSAQCRGPVLFKFDQRSLGLRLILGAIGGERGQPNRQQNSKQDQNFHVKIVTRVPRNEQVWWSRLSPVW
jgi:hypothetical protein